MASRQRGNGEGSIYQRKDGRWVGSISLPGGRRKDFYGKTRKEVQAKLIAAQRDLQQGLPIPGEKLTVGQYLTDWLENCVKGPRAPRTYESYSSLIRLHVNPELGKVRLVALTPQQ